MFCRYCGERIADNAVYCPKCGAKQFDDTPQTTFCKFCGSEIDADCVVCPKCGKQIAELKVATPNIVINNTQYADNNNANLNANINRNVNFSGLDPRVKACRKWTAFFLCFFFGAFGAHKFYEGKTGQGILYLLTAGIFGFGWIADIFILLFKPNPYYVTSK